MKHLKNIFIPLFSLIMGIVLALLPSVNYLIGFGLCFWILIICMNYSFDEE